MYAISIWQPWATLIALGIKRYETRHWKLDWIVGKHIAIHASKRWERDQKDDLARLLRQFPNELAAIKNYDFPFGAVLVACKVIKIHHAEDIRASLSDVERVVGGYADGRFAWELEIVKHPPVPIPAIGRQGVYKWYYQPTIVN